MAISSEPDTSIFFGGKVLVEGTLFDQMFLQQVDWGAEREEWDYPPDRRSFFQVFKR